MRTWTKACAIKPYQFLESIQTNEVIDTPGSWVGNSTTPAFRTHQPQICSRACSPLWRRIGLRDRRRNQL